MRLGQLDRERGEANAILSRADPRAGVDLTPVMLSLRGSGVVTSFRRLMLLFALIARPRESLARTARPLVADADARKIQLGTRASPIVDL